MRITRQALAAATAVGVAAAGGSAFTASNSVPTTTRVGQAAQATSGYDITNVTYTLDASLANGNGDRVTTVNMDVAPDNTGTARAKAVRVRVVTGGAYYECTGSTVAVAWSCTLTGGVAASSINTLDVVAIN